MLLASITSVVYLLFVIKYGRNKNWPPIKICRDVSNYIQFDQRDTILHFG